MPEKSRIMRMQLFGAIRKTQKKRAKQPQGRKEMIKIGYKMMQNSELESYIEINTATYCQQTNKQEGRPRNKQD